MGQSRLMGLIMLKSLLAGSLSLALIGFSGAAQAAPVIFTYTGEMTRVTGGLSALVSVGDIVTIEVVSDNGSSSLNSQTWDALDTVSATFTAGSYSATFDGDWFRSAGTAFVTDATGNLIDALWVGVATNLTSIDTFGTGADLNNGQGFTSNGDTYNFGPSLSTFDAWSGPTIAAVPEPATLALVGAGLAGLGVAARRRRKA